MTRILLFKEKYDNVYYIFDTEEERNKIALDVLRERNEEGWYPQRESIDSRESQKIFDLLEKMDATSELFYNMPLNDLEKLPDTVKHLALNTRQEIDRKVAKIKKVYNIERKFFELLDNLLSADDEEAVKMVYVSPITKTERNLAWELLSACKDEEYQNYEIIEPVNR